MGLRYSQGKYGTFRYGLADAGFQFKVQISDSSGNIKTLLNNQIKELVWSYERMGGCRKFQMVLKREYDDLSNLTAEDLQEIYDFRIYITSGFGGTSTLYWRGYITGIRPNMRDGEETVVDGVGYGERFDEIQMSDGTGAPKEYTSTTISGLVSTIINDFIVPNTTITAGTIDTFSTTVTSIKFNGSVKEAIDKLAEIVGAEWGVDRNRQFYFRSPSTTVGFRFLLRRDISLMEDELDYSEIVNKVYVEGGDIDDGAGGSVPFRYVEANNASISLYGLKERRVSNSSVVENSVAVVLARSVLDKYKMYRRNIRIELPLNKSLIEVNNPIGLIVLVDDPKLITHKYSTFKYGEQKYSGETKHRVESINYELRDLSLSTSIEFNDGKPDVDSLFNQLEFEIEQQRQAQGV